MKKYETTYLPADSACAVSGIFQLTRLLQQLLQTHSPVKQAIKTTGMKMSKGEHEYN